MGNPDNITTKTFEHMAEHLHKTPEEVKLMVFEAIENGTIDQNETLREMFDKAAAAWGQSREDALKEAHKMLKREFRK